MAVVYQGTFSLNSSCGSTDSSRWLSMLYNSRMRSNTCSDRSLTDVLPSISTWLKNWQRTGHRSQTASSLTAKSVQTVPLQINGQHKQLLGQYTHIYVCLLYLLMYDYLSYLLVVVFSLLINRAERELCGFGGFGCGSVIAIILFKIFTTHLLFLGKSLSFFEITWCKTNVLSSLGEELTFVM